MYATNKANLFEMSDALPGSRVLDGRWGLEHLAIAIPKGRDAGLAYMGAFAETAKSEGLVAHAAARGGAPRRRRGMKRTRGRYPYPCLTFAGTLR